MIHGQAFALEQDVQPPIAKARAHGGMRLQPLEHRDVASRSARR